MQSVQYITLGNVYIDSRGAMPSLLGVHTDD
jgi:hypothetical protein